MAWTLLPQALIGAGLALAVPALSHAALDRPPLAVQGAWSIAARHAGVVVGLLLLTPLLVADLNTQSDRAQEAGAARGAGLAAAVRGQAPAGQRAGAPGGVHRQRERARSDAGLPQPAPARVRAADLRRHRSGP